MGGAWHPIRAAASVRLRARAVLAGRRSQLAQRAQRLEAVAGGHVDVADHEVDAAVLGRAKKRKR
jgi:hypothetical protein